jgi:hypothetical protein
MNVQGDLGNVLPGYWVPLNGPEDLKPSPAPERSHPSTQSAMRRARLPTQHSILLEKNRQTRAAEVLEKSMRSTQRAAARERRHRGVFMDAWIKARALPADYDTDEDELNRPAGIDDIPGDQSANEDTETFVHLTAIGDVGAQTETFTKAFRTLGKAMEIPAFTRRRRAPRPEREDTRMDIDEHEGTPADVIVLDEDDADDTPAATPVAKPKRAPAKRKSRAAVVAEGDGSAKPTPSSSRRRTITSSKPGSQGVPLKDFYAGSEAGTPVPTARSATTAARGNLKKRDRDEMEQEDPLNSDDAELLEHEEEVEYAARYNARKRAEEEAETVKGMEGVMAGAAKEHGASLMGEAEALLSTGNGKDAEMKL